MKVRVRYSLRFSIIQESQLFKVELLYLTLFIAIVLSCVSRNVHSIML
jgi:hypothetical protein